MGAGTESCPFGQVEGALQRERTSLSVSCISGGWGCPGPPWETNFNLFLPPSIPPFLPSLLPQERTFSSVLISVILSGLFIDFCCRTQPTRKLLTGLIKGQDFLFLFKDLLFLFCVYEVLRVYVHHMRAWCLRRLKEGLGSSGTGFKDVSHHVGNGNQTQVL